MIESEKAKKSWGFPRGKTVAMIGADIRDAKEFAVAFANAVTLATESSDVIARKGDESIFGVLEKVFPQVFVL